MQYDDYLMLTEISIKYMLNKYEWKMGGKSIYEGPTIC